MAINADKPHLWKADIAASVDQFNQWFLLFAPKAYRDSRAAATVHVEEGFRLTNDLTALTPDVLKQNPGVLPFLRMSTCPPLARDRLIGLAGASKNLVKVMEDKKAIPKRMPAEALEEDLARIADTISRMLDVEIFPWIISKAMPTEEEERHRASTIVADRLCGAVSDPIVRNAQEKRQLALIAEYLEKRGYRQQAHPAGLPLDQMEPGPSLSE
jgi:XamI restriction endonuclease